MHAFAVPAYSALHRFFGSLRIYYAVLCRCIADIITYSAPTGSRVLGPFALRNTLHSVVILAINNFLWPSLQIRTSERARFLVSQFFSLPFCR